MLGTIANIKFISTPTPPPPPEYYILILQVMCVFVAARIITMFSLQYFPILFLNTLNMNEVRGN